MSNVISEETIPGDLAELSRKTGLVVRSFDSSVANDLFAKLEEFDSEERAETLDHLKHALNETRASLGAEPVYNDIHEIRKLKIEPVLENLVIEENVVRHNASRLAKCILTLARI